MLKNFVFLTQTDTTIGFVSQNSQKLTDIKNRPNNKHYIKAVNSLQTLKMFARIPNEHKKRVRRSSNTTFILPNTFSYRVINNSHHLLLLGRLKWVYTTSANLSHQAYDEVFCKEKADIIIEPLKKNKEASSIIQLGQSTMKRVR